MQKDDENTGILKKNAKNIINSDYFIILCISVKKNGFFLRNRWTKNSQYFHAAVEVLGIWFLKATKQYFDNSK